MKKYFPTDYITIDGRKCYIMSNMTGNRYFVREEDCTLPHYMIVRQTDDDEFVILHTTLI